MSFAGRDLLTLSDRERRQMTGRDMAMIFQEPATSLNPCFSVGFQLTETLRQHTRLSQKAATERAVELLGQVGIPDPARRLQDYPHLLSGGMNQRVMIAMAIACNPRLLIADEPTTALDVTIQAQILDLLRQLQRERGMALVLITHNMGVVAEMAQRVAVMYAGQVVEDRPAQALFAAPEHPYTAALLAGAARAARRRRRSSGDDSRHGAGSVRPAARLPVQPALCGCDTALPPRTAGADRDRSGPSALPLPDHDGRPRGRDRARPSCRCTRGTRRSGGGRPMSGKSAPVVEASGLRQVYTVRRGMLREAAAVAGGRQHLIHARGRAHTRRRR